MIGHPIQPESPDDKRVWELPNGKFVYRTEDGAFEVQPIDDNWWHREETLERAVEWFATQWRTRL